MNYLKTTGTSYEIIHNKSIGKITIAQSIDCSNGTFTHLCYGKYGTVNIPDVNSFFSINTFNGWRARENIFELKANFLDFDFSYEKDRIRFLIDYKNGRFNALPKPTLVILSGHGVWMLWLYKDTAYCRKGRGKDSIINQPMLNKWKNIQKLLFEKTGLVADEFALDVARVMRPSGSINAKPNMPPVQVEIFEYNPDCLYTLEELYTALSGMTRQEYFDAQAKAKAPQKTTKSGNKNNYNLYKTNHNRVDDLEKLVEIRPDGFYDGCGYRELFLFVYAYHVQIITHDIEKTLDRVKRLNSKFKNPLPAEEIETAVINTVEQAVKNREIVILTGPYAGNRMGYNYKTETLIEMLKITPEEQEQLKTLCGRDIKANRRNDKKRADRRFNGLTQKEQKKANNIYAVHTYAKQGLEQTEIVIATGLSKSTVSKYLNLPCPDVSVITSELQLHKKVS